jgi:uncharacterized damage-inducible protein DinB
MEATLTMPVVDEKEILVRRLRESEEKFVAAASVSEDCAAIKPSKDGWSILEVVEHVTLSDREMLRCYLDAGSNERQRRPDAEAAIAAFGSDIGMKLQAPAHVFPAGRHQSLVEALQAYREVRRELVDFVNAEREDFRGRILPHPMTDMDGHQIFLFVAAHSDRHARQIEEIKKSAAYKAA